MDGRQQPLGITDPADRDGAVAALKLLMERAKSVFPNGIDGLRQGTAADLVPGFIERKKHFVNPRTCAAYSSYLRRFVAQFGRCAISEIDPDAVELKAKQETWSDSNRHNYLYCVQSFIRWAGRRDFTLKRPAKESRGAEAFIDDKTATAIFRESTGDFHQLLRFLWLTGCRPMEAARLTVETIDPVTGVIRVRQHKTKHKGKIRQIFPGPEAWAILHDQIDRHKTGPLFCGIRGDQLSLQAIVTRFIRLSTRVGRSVTAYHFRHTFITRALILGHPDTHVAALVGTSTEMIRKHYSHVAQQSGLMKELAAKIESAKTA